MCWRELVEESFSMETPLISSCEDAIVAADKYIKQLEEIVKATAHIGVDFGYGKYEVEPHLIEKARKLLKESKVDD